MTPRHLNAELSDLAHAARLRLLTTPLPQGAAEPTSPPPRTPFAPWNLLQNIDYIDNISKKHLPPTAGADILARTIRALDQLCAERGHRLPPLILARAAPPRHHPKSMPSPKSSNMKLIAAAITSELSPPPLRGRRLKLTAPTTPTARAELLAALADASTAALTRHLGDFPFSALIAAAERAEAGWLPCPPPAPRTPLSALRRAAVRAWTSNPSQSIQLKQLFAAGDDTTRRADDIATALAEISTDRQSLLMETLSPHLDAPSLWATLHRDALQTVLPTEAATRLWAANRSRPLSAEPAALLATATPPALASAMLSEAPQQPAHAILNLLADADAVPPPFPRT